MRGTILFLSAVLLSATCVHAQTHFQRAFGPLVTSNAFDVRYAVRHASGSWTMRASQPNPSTVLRMNADGTDTWIRKLSSPGFSTNSGIINIGAGPANSAVVVRLDTVEQLGSGQSRRSVDLVRLLEDGSLGWAWQYTYDVPEVLFVPSGGHALAMAADGGFFLDSGEPSRPLIMRFAADGTPIWIRELIADFPIGELKDMVATDDGGCVLLANGSEEFPQPERIILAKIGADGSLLWDRNYDPAAAERRFLPHSLIERMDGHLLVSAIAYGAGEPSAGVLLDLEPDGAIQWVRLYRFGEQGSLTTYSAVERSDGHIWMDFQQGGYGFTHLGSTGEVLATERFTYGIMGNTTSVVAWEEILMHEDHLGVVGGYFQDQSWTNEDPRTEWLWSLDAMDPAFCGSESVVITSYPIATTDVVEGTGLSLIDASVTGHAVAVDLETPALPEHIQACGIILDVEGPSPPQTLRIRPSVAEVGTLIVVETEGAVHTDFVDLTGRIGTEIRLAPSGTGVLSTADLWPGTWLLRSWNAQGDLIGTARIQLF